MTALRDDLRYAIRMLFKAPGFAATALLTVALGIGVNIALFSVVNGVLLNPLTYPSASQLVALYEDAPGFAKAPISYLNFLDWQRLSQTCSSMAIYRNQDYSVTGGSQAERVSGYMVSADFFRTLGQNPLVGRDFEAADDHLGSAPVVMLGGGYWQRRFGASSAVLGTSLTLNGVPYTVVGVIPPQFTFYGSARDVYTPIGRWNDPSFRDRSVDVSTHAIGRLKPGETVLRARADMDHVARDLAAAFPDADRNIGITVLPLKQDIVGNVQPFLLVLVAAVGFLLLIACGNVANLLLARSIGRSQEFAIRAALGASQTRVIRQLLTESLLVASLGGALGLLLAAWGTKGALDVLPRALPRAAEVAFDAHVLIFGLGASLLAGLLVGLAPALRTSRLNVHEVLKQFGRGSSGTSHRLQRTFVAVEVALALVLLVGAGLMLRSLQALWAVDPGFRPDHALTFTLSLPSAPNTTSAETRARLRRFDEILRSVPGVQAVSVTLGSRPMIHDTALPFWIDGRPKPSMFHDMPQAMCYLVEAGFQPAMGITLERGRFVRAQDDEYAPLVIDIDDVFARTYFPSEDPIGRRVNIAGFDVQATVVGIVGHIKQWRLDADPASAVEAQIDYPFMQLPEKLMPLVSDAVATVLRTSADPGAIMASVRQAVNDEEPGDVIYAVETMDDVVSTSFAARRLSMILLGVFSTLAATLACVGIYGVISHLVSQRTHEIGVRLALGAQPAEMMRLILGQGGRMALLGTALGTVAALGLARLLSAQLFGVTAHDPLTFAVVAVLLMVVAVAACYVPARRAMRVDPLVALRHE
jgi:predicted permease